MFEKKEDQLFDYAFGELDAHDAQIFEAGLLNDEEALAEVEFLRTMKDDLVSLRDIPEMQFSKERLRAAILEQGLKPKKPMTQWLNWVLAPTATACVLVLGFVLMNGVSHKDTQFIPGPNSFAMTSQPPKIDAPIVNKSLSGPMIHSTPVATTTKNDSVHPSSQPVKSEVVHHSRKHKVTGNDKAPTNDPGMIMVASNDISDSAKRSTAALVGDSHEVAKADAAVTGVARDAAFDNSANSDAMKVAFGNTFASTSTADSKMIEIDNDSDSGVGAAVATEVNNTANVVIGG